MVDCRSFLDALASLCRRVVLYARAAQQAEVDSIIAMAPARTNAATAIDMFKRLGDVFDGPIMVQNADSYAPLTGEQIVQLAEDVPQIEYVKEERQPGPQHIGEVKQLAGDRIKTIFGGAAGKVLPAEITRGADGCMPACEFADLLARLWSFGGQAMNRGAGATHPSASVN